MMCRKKRKAIVIHSVHKEIYLHKYIVSTRDYVLFRFGVKHDVACQHSQQTRRLPNPCPMLAHRLRSIAAGLVLLTAGGD